MTDLVEELKTLSESNIKTDLIELASKGEFHDYRSSNVCGKMYFVKLAFEAKAFVPESDAKILDRLSNDIKDGVYDEPYTEEDKDHLRAELANDKDISDRDREFFSKMMGL